MLSARHLLLSVLQLFRKTILLTEIAAIVDATHALSELGQGSWHSATVEGALQPRDRMFLDR